MGWPNVFFFYKRCPVWMVFFYDDWKRKCHATLQRVFSYSLEYPQVVNLFCRACPTFLHKVFSDFVGFRRSWWCSCIFSIKVLLNLVIIDFILSYQKTSSPASANTKLCTYLVMHWPAGKYIWCQNFCKSIEASLNQMKCWKFF